MNTTVKVFRYVLTDVIRRRWVIGYAALFAVLTAGLFWLGGSGPRLVVSLLDVVLLIIPLVSVVFAALYVYNAQGFLELVLSQPVSRRELFTALWAALLLPLAGAFALGAGVPLALAGEGVATVALLVGTGVALTIIFGALGLYLAAAVADRLRGLGLALGLWVAATVIYDGAILITATLVGGQSAAAPVLGAMVFNPVDLARLLLLTRLDAPALMGYTGALVQRLLGAPLGAGLAAAALALWCVVPTLLGRRALERRDW
jgi:Cu-processing system permease protein